MKTVETPVICASDIQFSWQIRPLIEKHISAPLLAEGIKFEIIDVPPEGGLQLTLFKVKITLP